MKIFLKYENEFLLEKEFKHQSQKTIKNYSNFLKLLFKFMKEENLSENDINEFFMIKFFKFREEKIKKSLSPHTKKSYIIYTKAFFKYLNKRTEFNIDMNIFKELNIKVPKRKPKIIEKKDIESLIEYVKELDKSNSILKHRKSLMIKMLIYSGIRANELCNLKIEDFRVGFENGVKIYNFSFIAKGDEEHSSYILANLIENNLEFMRDNNKVYAFESSKQSKPITPNDAWYIIKRVYSSLGIKESGLHKFRHTFAQRLLLEQNVPMPVVQALMNHKDITTTVNIYGRAGESDKKKAILGQFI